MERITPSFAPSGRKPTLSASGPADGCLRKRNGSTRLGEARRDSFIPRETSSPTKTPTMKIPRAGIVGTIHRRQAAFRRTRMASTTWPATFGVDVGLVSRATLFPVAREGPPRAFPRLSVRNCRRLMVQRYQGPADFRPLQVLSHFGQLRPGLPLRLGWSRAVKPGFTGQR